MLKKPIISILCVTNIMLHSAFACTSFGIITKSGSIIGKNRDYLYGEQTFKLIHAIKQFEAWYGNQYKHKNNFYALTFNNDIKMGVNKYGLTAIEEDPTYTVGTDINRKYIQPIVGYSEGMILYGILQNFATVQEIVPYLNEIFSTAAPNFYQIADAHSILTVEVAYGDTNTDPKRKFTYKVISKNGEYFAHTNTYLSPEFEHLNSLQQNKDILAGSNKRLQKITTDIVNSNGDYSKKSSWFMDTSSDLGIASNKNWCQTTSIFRSNLQHLTRITPETNSSSVYGTVSNLIVENNDNGSTMVHLKIIDSIDTLKNGGQLIKYRELNTPLATLFATNKLNFTKRILMRSAPINGVCR